MEKLTEKLTVPHDRRRIGFIVAMIVLGMGLGLALLVTIVRAF